ncbi:EAL domain-containing protein [Cohaesibacter sp. CAU 1516]|uniref:putative bifunctional diguanylate cyclase/phosphodiesterase n=1 Tax=Cohaesibacter sp. CAU 1516 TaxID=2576038 RepID=UPI0010FCE604|nr:EAL domain-containing protein [Cohaesibacter sp. CAU 1516]TLP46107.1 EAL domain-containing protein [Cohaesibacter sp. CAU 1516]
MWRKLLSSKHLEPALVSLLAILVWIYGEQHDAFETLVTFMEAHEGWELDELFLAAVVFGLAGAFNYYRHLYKQSEEGKRRARAESDLDWLSRHDNLTGLPNRHYLKSFVDKTERGFGKKKNQSEAKSYGLIALDLDGFKKINDLTGHAGGDRLLKQVAERITSNEAIKLAFRLGGDEFLAVVNLAETPDLEAVAENLRNSILKPIVIDGITNHIGVSVGLAKYPQDSRDLTGAINNADIAMYHAKRSGKNCVATFEPEMLELKLQRSQFEQDLLAAMARNEIKPHYQPLFDLKAGELRGFEALARWTRNGHGPVSPEKFIALAEDMGVITELSDQLLLQACKDAKTWPADLTLSFNLSPLQLSDRLVGLRILSVLGEAGLPPHRLEVEITESSLVNDMETASFVLKSLHNAGVRIALDDFGTGYSNLLQLSNLYFDRIKIDRSFIASVNTDEKQMRIVKTILSLGEGLGLHTTAEGIEEMEQMSILKDLGCDYGQGFHLGKPVDAAQTTDFIVAHFEKKASKLRVSA